MLLDQAILEQETKDLTQSIKNKTYRLKEIEGKGDDVSGFFLNPIPKNEAPFLQQL